MAADIPEIMTGIKDRLATIIGLRASDYAIGNPQPPAAFPLVPDFDYRNAMRRGNYVIPFRVVVLVSAQLDRVGQHLLAEYASQTGEKSIRAALEGDRETTGRQTLGGLVDDLVVDSFTTTGLEEVGIAGYFGGIFNLRVSASGA